MKKILTLLSLSLLLSLSFNDIHAQEDFNQTDKLGRRQGKWLDYHDNGQLRYTGQFKNNEPYGDFLYYSEDGHLVAKNSFSRNGNESESEMYSPDGKVIAKGHYLNKKKQGKWEYFSEKDSSLILTEHYDNGMLIGKSVAYNPGTQVVIEETEFVNGVKQGVYTKYYDNGVTMVKAFYNNDKLDGKYTYYYSNGNVKEEGNFNDGVKIGEWKTYDTDGNLLSTDNHERESYDDPDLDGVELY